MVLHVRPGHPAAPNSAGLSQPGLASGHRAVRVVGAGLLGRIRAKVGGLLWPGCPLAQPTGPWTSWHWGLWKDGEWES